MNKETLERLLNRACEILIIYENSGNASIEVLESIASIFDEIKYSDDEYVDSEIKADQEEKYWRGVQTWLERHSDTNDDEW